MTEKFKILAQFIKDASVETPDVETYLFVKDNLTKYHLNIDITSKPLKNKMIEVDTVLRFKDNEANERKSFFEITYTSIVKVDEGIDSKKDLEKVFVKACVHKNDKLLITTIPLTISPNLI